MFKLSQFDRLEREMTPWLFRKLFLLGFTACVARAIWRFFDPVAGMICHFACIFLVFSHVATLLLELDERWLARRRRVHKLVSWMVTNYDVLMYGGGRGVFYILQAIVCLAFSRRNHEMDYGCAGIMAFFGCLLIVLALKPQAQKL